MSLIRKRAPLLLLEAVMLLLSLTVIVPFLIMIFGSLKTGLEATAFDLTLPVKWMWQNYKQAIVEGDMVRSFVNGAVITCAAVALNIVTTSMAAFIIARKNTRLSGFLYYFFFIGMIAPMQLIPTIRLFQSIELYGTYLSVILIYCSINMAFSIFLYTGFIRTTIPQALDEAAVLEGASLVRLFFGVVFPLLKPINLTILIIVFMNIWNDINIPLFFLSDPDKWTLPLSVYQFFGMFSGSSWNLVFANLVLTALPIIVLYLFCQRYIVSGLTAGAVK
ncbi:carbohydrate ABC transporter permease [Cohnella lupini]|uniref:Carbohydrate ABC transporter membrane protein 2 (CUT1 family) n=1 Tax=Cohnella lupini TaxID=1294267 RepID=A0A3D9I0I9_9BACL|nr:carbohydrate ABC transporter permease [Cohnella lupini]RED55292.1 carbohydrate ABC transporter membrane protein 2 (CUT1 family) [Cohnella lupini]